jgi:hypothetical protein
MTRASPAHSRPRLWSVQLVGWGCLIAGAALIALAITHGQAVAGLGAGLLIVAGHHEYRRVSTARREWSRFTSQEGGAFCSNCHRSFPDRPEQATVTGGFSCPLCHHWIEVTSDEC